MKRFKMIKPIYYNLSLFFFSIFIFFLFPAVDKNLVNAHLCGPGTGCASPLDSAPIPVPEMDASCTPNKKSDPDFHSLRPYQAANCGDSDKNRFCFNNYEIAEEFSTTWSITCNKFGSTYSCPIDKKIEKTYVIDGEYARFPIMGNTEQVTNSQGPQ